MNNKRTFEKVLIFGLLSIVAIFAAASISSAALTLSGTSVVSDGALTLTGAAASTLDLGSGNTLSIQTTNNGPVTFGTGAFTIGGVASSSELRSPSSTLTNVSSTRITVGTSIDGAKGNLTNVSSTNVDVATRFTSANVSSTNVDVATRFTSANVSSTNVDVATRFTSANVSSTNVDITTRLTSANVSSTNVDVATRLVTALFTATASSTFKGPINSTGTVDAVATGLCGTTPTIQGANGIGIVTTGSNASSTCTITFGTAFANKPSCNIRTETAAQYLSTTTVITPSATTLVISQTSSSQFTSAIFDYICIGNQ